jgi:hypothetical protein
VWCGQGHSNGQQAIRIRRLARSILEPRICQPGDPEEPSVKIVWRENTLGDAVAACCFYGYGKISPKMGDATGTKSRSSA